MNNQIGTIVEDGFVPKKYSKNFTIASRGKEVRFRDECEFAKNIVNDSPILQRCTKESLFRELVMVAHVGLTLNKVKAHAYLTPRKIKTDAGYEWQVVMIPGYRGLIHLATKEGGSVSHINANIVFEGEDFEFIDGTSPSLTHKPNPFIDPAKAKPIGAYCVTTLRSGMKMITFMRADEIMLCRQSSESKNSDYSPWKKHWQEMWKKSVIRRAAKTWPDSVMTGDVVKAIQIMDEHDPTEGAIKPKVETITEKQAEELALIPLDYGLDVAPTLSKIFESYNVGSLKQLPAEKLGEVQDRLRNYCEKKSGSAA